MAIHVMCKVSFSGELPLQSLRHPTLVLNLWMMQHEQAVLHHGSPFSLLRKIDQRQNLSLGIIGASVAQNAGCYDAEKRCGAYQGLKALPHHVLGPNNQTLTVHEPITGWAVKFVKKLEAFNPGLKIQIHNAALDATPLKNVLECFHSHLPAELDLVIIEPGSMSHYNKPADLDKVVNRLRALPNVPYMILISFHEWLHRLSGEWWGFHEQTIWQRMEDASLKICRHLNVTCFSPRNELYPRLMNNKSELFEYVGPDGLHPIQSRHGVSHITDIFWEWYMESRRRNLIPIDIPRVAVDDEGSKCYNFAGTTSVAQRFLKLQWKTSICPTCSKHTYLDHVECDYKSQYWTFCKSTNHKDETKKKISPGIVGTQPNSTLWLKVDTSIFPRPRVVLDYLSNTVDAGRVQYACLSGCRCHAGVIDSLNKDTGYSIFRKSRPIGVTPSARCRMRFTMHPESQGLFKIRFLFVEPGRNHSKFHHGMQNHVKDDLGAPGRNTTQQKQRKSRRHK